MGCGDVAHSGFGKASGQQKSSPKFVGVVFSDAVALASCLGFLIQIHDSGSHALHAEGELAIAKFDFKRIGVEAPDEIEVLALTFEACFEIVPLQAIVAGFENRRTGVDGGQEARGKGAVVFGSEIDVAGQASIVGPESVEQPISHRGSNLPGHAGVEHRHGGGVILVVVVQRVDEAKLVDPLAVDLGKQVAGPVSGLAPLFEFEGRTNDASPLREGELWSLNRFRQFLAMFFLETRFVVVGVDLGEAAIEEDKDHPLGPGREMRFQDRTVSRRVGPSLSREQVRECQSAHAHEGTARKGRQGVCVDRIHSR